jgi:transposase
MAIREVHMSSKRYPEEFKVEAVRQVTERGHSVAEVAVRLGVTAHSLYAWLKKYGPRSVEYQADNDQAAEIRRLKAELKRVSEERDILKKAAAYFAKHHE